MRTGPRLLIAFAALGGVAVFAAALIVLGSIPAHAQAAAVGAAAEPGALRWAFASAAAAAGIGSLAAGYAVATVGSAAVGALAEKPELLGRVLILVGLAEGIAIYGLIVAILILNRA